jgi:NAD(P)-dependent dehydrogenase (short-subunit alcohol dehydrogenase family)
MNQQTSNLHGKKLIVLGGSSGIGFATAKAAAAEGAIVTIISGNQQRIHEALQQLPAGSTGIAADLSKEDNIRVLFSDMEKFDHMVYTAGENIRISPIGSSDIDAAKQYFNIRYWGAVAAVKYGAPLINEGGSVTLTGGIAAARPGAGWWLGSGICAAMEGFTRAMAVELAPLRVNLVSPGVVKTNLWNSMSDTDREQFYEAAGNALPVKRIGAPEDIAQAYLYCMKQGFGTGHILVADGGALLV